MQLPCQTIRMHCIFCIRRQSSKHIPSRSIDADNALCLVNNVVLKTFFVSINIPFHYHSRERERLCINIVVRNIIFTHTPISSSVSFVILLSNNAVSHIDMSFSLSETSTVVTIQPTTESINTTAVSFTLKSTTNETIDIVVGQHDSDDNAIVFDPRPTTPPSDRTYSIIRFTNRVSPSIVASSSASLAPDAIVLILRKMSIEDVCYHLQGYRQGRQHVETVVRFLDSTTANCMRNCKIESIVREYVNWSFRSHL